MHHHVYAAMEDEQLFELLFTVEDRMDAEAAEEIARRDGLAPYLGQLAMDKQSWLAELPEWWAVVHATYLLGHRGEEEGVLPLLAALRWSDAFDCDWVTELLPSIFGRLGSMCIPGLTAVCRDQAAGWSARDLALKSMAAISLTEPASTEHVFRIVGERFMDEGEERLLRQLSGQILLDFRRVEYRMALGKFAREEWAYHELDMFYPLGLDPEEVEAAFRYAAQPETWHYQEDWMRFYQPAEIQRRQKRWARERISQNHPGRDRMPPTGGGRVLPLWRTGKPPDPTQQPDQDPGQDSGQDPEDQHRD